MMTQKNFIGGDYYPPYPITPSSPKKNRSLTNDRKLKKCTFGSIRALYIFWHPRIMGKGGKSNTMSPSIVVRMSIFYFFSAPPTTMLTIRKQERQSRRTHQHNHHQNLIQKKNPNDSPLPLILRDLPFVFDNLNLAKTLG